VAEKTPLWETYPKLVQWVREDHLRVKAFGGGHDFLHALMVAQYGKLIAEDERVGTLAWIAGICHNADRLFPDLEDREIAEFVGFQIDRGTDVSSDEKRIIVEAVLRHSELNKLEDNPVTVALKDADRLVNIGPGVVIRSGQLFHDLPAFDPRFITEQDPRATYRKPMTSFRDLQHHMEWEEMLRLPRAREIARPWFEASRAFLAGFERQLREVGLLPYPFGEEFEAAYQQSKRG